MYTEQIELPTPFSQEELDALWFFGLGFYYKHSFWVVPGLLKEDYVEVRLRGPLTRSRINVAIQNKLVELFQVPSGVLSVHICEQRKIGLRYTRVLRRLTNPYRR